MSDSITHATHLHHSGTTRRCRIVRRDGDPRRSHGLMASASTPSGRGDPSLLVRDGSSIGHAGSPFTFEVTNRGPEPVRVAAITVDGDGVADGDEVRVDAQQSVTARTDDTDGTVTFRLVDSTTVEPGDAARDTVGFPLVVVVEEGDEFPVGGPDPGVPCRVRALIRLVSQTADLAVGLVHPVCQQRFDRFRGGVVDDDEFEGVVRLGEDAVDGLAEHLRSTIRRDNRRHQRFFYRRVSH